MNNQQLPPMKIAFILDGKVQDIIHTEDRMAAMLLSQPVIVDVTSYYQDKPELFNVIGWDWDGEKLNDSGIQVMETQAVQPDTTTPQN